MIPPGRPMDREPLTQAVAWLESRVADEPEHNGYQSAIDDLKTFALEQLRDAAPRGEKVPKDSRWEGLRHYIFDEWGDVSDGLSDLAKLQRWFKAHDIPTPVGGQTPTEPPKEGT